MKKFLFTIYIITLFSSCASFSNKMVSKDRMYLTKNNFQSLSGTYEILPNKEYDKKGNQKSFIKNEYTENAFSFLSSTKVQFDSLENYFLKIKIENNSSIKFTLKSETTKEITINGKLKSNGFFHLNNKYLKCHGIPYIFGGCNNHKTRVGLNQDNELLIQYAEENSGAFLLVLGTGYAYNLTYSFNRIASD